MNALQVLRVKCFLSYGFAYLNNGLTVKYCWETFLRSQFVFIHTFAFNYHKLNAHNGHNFYLFNCARTLPGVPLVEI